MSTDMLRRLTNYRLLLLLLVLVLVLLLVARRTLQLLIVTDPRRLELSNPVTRRSIENEKGYRF